jgi:putative membrane protein
MVFMRYRRLSRTTVLIPRKRIQRLTFTQNPFQKRGQVLDLIVTVASGRTGASFRVQHMANEIEAWMQPWLFDREEKQEKSKISDKGSKVKRLPGF